MDTLDAKFALKDLGALIYFLGIQVYYLKFDFLQNQAIYVDDLLHKLDISKLKSTGSPCALRKRLSTNEGTPLKDLILYGSTIGALQCLTHTRLDIACIINHLSQFLKAPKDVHWQATKRVL